MKLANQKVRTSVENVSVEECFRSVKLLSEEFEECVNDLGFEYDYVIKRYVAKRTGTIFDPVEKAIAVADSCIDIMVVVTGILSQFGLEDLPLLEIVDQNNLKKFGPGHSYSSEGKLLKPADFVGPQEEIRKYVESRVNTKVG